jgi:hypothetical protein
LKVNDIIPLRDKYIELAVPLLSRPALVGALTLDWIDNKLKAAESLREKGRTAKARNKWDQE